MSRRRFSVNDLVPSQSEACDASVPRGAKDRKRTVQDGEQCRAAKRARNRKDLLDRAAYSILAVDVLVSF